MEGPLNGLSLLPSKNIKINMFFLVVNFLFLWRSVFTYIYLLKEIKARNSLEVKNWRSESDIIAFRNF